MAKTMKLALLTNLSAPFVEVSESCLRETSGVVRQMFKDGDLEHNQILFVPFITDTQVLGLFYHTIWPKWSADVFQYNFRTLSTKDFNETMAAWACEPSRFLLEFENTTFGQQASLGQLGHQLEIPFLETLYMLSLVRLAQRYSALSEWRTYVEANTDGEFTQEKQKEAVISAKSAFPFLVQESPPSEMCAAQPPRTGAKRPACEY